MALRFDFPLAALALGSLVMSVIGCAGDDDMREGELPELPADFERMIEENRDPLEQKVSMKRLSEHLSFLTREPRSAGSAHLGASREYCASQLESFGFEVEQIPIEGTEFVNVVGKRVGVERPDSNVVLSAHIDGVPDCEGADDNASGVAGVLEAARLLAKRDHRNTLVVACWDGEEQGLAGSMHYAATQRELGAEILVAYVLEMIGYASSKRDSQRLPVSSEEEPFFRLLYPEAYDDLVARKRRGDFIALLYDAPRSITPAGASHAAERFGAAPWVEIRNLKMPLTTAITDALPDTTRSDHASFWRHGYSALLITDTANLRNPHYHCEEGEDSIDTLDLDFMTRVTRATVRSLVDELERNTAPRPED